MVRVTEFESVEELNKYIRENTHDGLLAVHSVIVTPVYYLERYTDGVGDTVYDLCTEVRYTLVADYV